MLTKLFGVRARERERERDRQRETEKERELTLTSTTTGAIRLSVLLTNHNTCNYKLKTLQCGLQTRLRMFITSFFGQLTPVPELFMDSTRLAEPFIKLSKTFCS